MCEFQSTSGEFSPLFALEAPILVGSFHYKYNIYFFHYTRLSKLFTKKSRTPLLGCDLFFYNKMWGKECDV